MSDEVEGIAVWLIIGLVLVGLSLHWPTERPRLVIYLWAWASMSFVIIALNLIGDLMGW